MVIFFIAILAGIIIGGLGYRVYQLSCVSKGNPIADTQTGKAVVVLDMQQDTLRIPQYKELAHVLSAINHVVDEAAGSGIPVIYSKQIVTHPVDQLLASGMYKADTEGVELSQQLSVVSSNIFSKVKSDFFSSGDFEMFLQAHRIGELYVVGADASACVMKTVEAGLNRKYKVTVLKDCLFSVNEKRLHQAVKQYAAKGAVVETQADFSKMLAAKGEPSVS